MVTSVKRPPRNPRYAAIGFLVVSLLGCAPLSVMQDARLVPEDEERVGFAGLLTLPLTKGTTYDPAYGTRVTQGKQKDLQYIPLPSVVGWYRGGLGWVEGQASFAVPSFIITLALKLGLIGRAPNSPFALSISGELNWSPLDGATTAGATLHTSLKLSDRLSLDLSGRVGNYPGFGLGLTVVPTLGVTLALAGRRQLHVMVGGTIPTGIAEAKASTWLAVGVSY